MKKTNMKLCFVLSPIARHLLWIKANGIKRRLRPKFIINPNYTCSTIPKFISKIGTESSNPNDSGLKPIKGVVKENALFH